MGTVNITKLYVHSSGTLIHTVNTSISRGNDSVNQTQYITPFDDSFTMYCNFQLANGEIVTEKPLRLIGTETLDDVGIFGGYNGETWNIKAYDIESPILTTLSKLVASPLFTSATVREQNSSYVGSYANESALPSGGSDEDFAYNEETETSWEYELSSLTWTDMLFEKTIYSSTQSIPSSPYELSVNPSIISSSEEVSVTQAELLTDWLNDVDTELTALGIEVTNDIANLLENYYTKSEISDEYTNKIEIIKVNGDIQTISLKAVDIDVPVKTSEIENDGNGTYLYVTTNDINELGTGDMAKVVYDTNDNGHADLADGVDDDTYSATAQEIQTAVDDSLESKIKTDFITVTQNVDLDEMETRLTALDTAIVLKGNWDASVGTFPTSTVAGETWIVSVGGTVDSVVFNINDRVIALVDSASTTVYANNWLKADYTDNVLSVNTQVGAVVLDTDDLLEGTNKYVSEEQKTKIDFLTVTQAVDLDTMESDIVTAKEDIDTLEKLVVLTYDSAGKFYATVDNFTLDTYRKMELLFPNTLTDLTTAVSVSLDGVAGTYKSLKYEDTSNEVTVKHTQNAKVNAYYNGTELVMKGSPLLNQTETYDTSIDSTYGDLQPIKGISQLEEVKGLSLNQEVVFEDSNTDGLADGFTLFRFDNQSFINGVQSIDNNTGSLAYYYRDNTTFTSGNTYYVSAIIGVERSQDVAILAMDNTTFNNAVTIASSTTLPIGKTKVSGTFTSARTDNRLSFQIVSPLLGETFTFEEVAIIDITYAPNTSIPTYFEGIQSISDFTLQSVGVNLFDMNAVDLDTNIETDGSLITFVGRFTSDYIPVKELTSYSGFINGWRNVFFDSNKNVITNQTTGITRTTPANTAYIRFTQEITNLDTFIIVEGSTELVYTSYNTDTISLTTDLLSVGDIRDIAYIDNGNWFKKAYVKEYILQTSDITGINTTTYTNLDRITITKPLDYYGYGIGDTSIGNVMLENGIYNEGNFSDTLDNVNKLFTNNSTTIIYYTVAKGTYADLTAVQTALVGTNMYYQFNDESITTTEISYSGLTIQENTTTLIQLDNFATEYDITFAHNESALVDIHSTKIKQLRDDVDDLNDITKIAFNRWQVSLTPTTQGALSKPDYDYTDLGLLFPNNDANEIAYIQSPAPTNWVAGTTIYPNVIVRQEADQQAVFKIDYKFLMPNTAIPTAWTTYTMETYKYTYSSGSVLNVLNGGDGIDTTGATNQAFLLIKLYRDDAVYTGDMLAYDFFIKYQAQGFGLTEE